MPPGGARRRRLLGGGRPTGGAGRQPGPAGAVASTPGTCPQWQRGQRAAASENDRSVRRSPATRIEDRRRRAPRRRVRQLPRNGADRGRPATHHGFLFLEAPRRRDGATYLPNWTPWAKRKVIIRTASMSAATNASTTPVPGKGQPLGLRRHHTSDQAHARLSTSSCALLRVTGTLLRDHCCRWSAGR